MILPWFASISWHFCTYLRRYIPKPPFEACLNIFLVICKVSEPQTKRGNQPSKTNNLIYPKSSLNQPYILYPPQINSQSVKAKLGQNELELNPKTSRNQPLINPKLTCLGEIPLWIEIWYSSTHYMCHGQKLATQSLGDGHQCHWWDFLRSEAAGKMLVML